MTRKASSPLNSKAVSAANNSVNKQFSPIPQSGDPNYGAFQQAWMDAYVAQGGAYTEETPQQATQNVKTARKQTASLTTTADATATCPNAAGVATLKAPSIPCTCKLIALDVSCEHEGRQARNGLLQVVSTNLNGDKITITPNAQGDCAVKLVTRVSGIPTRSVGETNFPHKGNSASQYKAFGPESVRNPFTVRPPGYPLISNVNATACDGNAQSVRVEAFPPENRKIEFDVSRFIEAVTGGFSKLPISDIRGFIEKGTPRKIARPGENKGFSPKEVVSASKSAYERDAKKLGDPTAVIKLARQWKEEKGTNLVYCDSSISGGFDPLFGGDFSVLLYGVPIPRKFKKYITAGIYLNVSGKFSVGLRCTWVYFPAPRDLLRFDSGSGELSGGMKVEIAAELFLLSDNCLKAKAAGSAAIEYTGSAKVTHQNEYWIEFDASIGTLKATLVGKAVWGLFEFEREWPIYDGYPYNDKFQILD